MYSNFASNVPIRSKTHIMYLFTSYRMLCTDIIAIGKPGAGNIKLSILKDRYKLLQQDGMLQDRTESYIGMDNACIPRTVFRNRHLYDPAQTDAQGRTNVQRMLKKLPPLCLSGKDILIIHHFDQKHTGAWVILEDSYHRKFAGLLHSRSRPKHGVDRSLFIKERRLYWHSEGVDRMLTNTFVSKPWNHKPRPVI